MPTKKGNGKLPTTRAGVLNDKKKPLLTEMFKGSGNPTMDLRTRENRDRYQQANFFGGLPNEKLSALKKDSQGFQDFYDFSKRRGAKLRQDDPNYMLQYNEEVDQPFRVPLNFSIPNAINKTSVGAPQIQPQTQLFRSGGELGQLPEYGFGSWLKENGAGLLKGAGSLVSMIPGIGTIAGPILSTAGTVIGKRQGDKAALGAEQEALDAQAAASAEEQRVADLGTRRTNIVDDKQVNYGGTFENGGQLGQGMMGQPQITEYTNGQKHGESAVGGIPVDAKGNPSTTSKSSAVGLTEKGEVTWNGYVFSDKIKIK